MSNIDTVNALITAINFDRFDEIEAYHAPDVLFTSFRGPVLRGSVAVADWHRQFLRDYADCNYSELEYIEDGDTVVVRATLEAKGYDWRAFTQRVVEVFRFEQGEIVERRLYGALRDLEFDKPTNAAMENALGYRGGTPSGTRKAFQDLAAAFAAGDIEAARGFFHDKPVLIDGVYGLAAGWEAMTALAESRPQPFFGVERVTAVFAGDHVAAAELAVEPARPRTVEWLRLVDGKVIVLEVYWMLREIGIQPDENYARDRHQRQVILPI
ncbi:MAG: nuclear transport factor 2 family protein [Dehalococcoidia bacterium]